MFKEQDSDLIKKYLKDLFVTVFSNGVIFGAAGGLDHTNDRTKIVVDEYGKYGIIPLFQTDPKSKKLEKMK